MIPNFLCVGAMKSGTTTLHNILKQHPNIYLPNVKELYFFDMNRNYNKGLKYYKKYYEERNCEKAVGEIAPTYLYHDFVPERIYSNLGENIKFLFCLRNPVDRAYSHYIMNCMKGYENNTFKEAIEIEPYRIKGDAKKKHRFSYIDQGYYSIQIKRYLKHFSKENMLFLIFEEDLLKNRDRTFKNITKFLDIEIWDFNLNVWSYAGKPVALPRFTFLDTLYNYSFIRKISSTKAINPFKKLLQKKIQNKIDYKDKIQLKNRYFLAEINVLQNIIEKDLKIWK